MKSSSWLLLLLVLAWLDTKVMFDSYPETCNAKEVICQDDGIKSRLLRKQKSLTQQLDCVNEALTVLDKNPEITALLELVKRAN